MHRCTTYKADIPHECCVLHTDTTHHTYLEFCGVSLGETSWNCFICRLCESFVYIILYSVFIFLTMCTYLWVEGFLFSDIFRDTVCPVYCQAGVTTFPIKAWVPTTNLSFFCHTKDYIDSWGYRYNPDGINHEMRLHGLSRLFRRQTP